MEDEAERVEIPHRESAHFTSAFASGVIVTGPSGDGLWHLVFYSEGVQIDHEIGIRVAENQYRVSPGVVAVDPFREDQGKNNHD